MNKNPTPPADARITARIPADMHRALGLVSAQTGETIQSLLIEGLDKAIRARANRVPFALPWPPARTK